MNRDEFMKELEYLLSDIPEEEKEDALNYYRDYLEEAGEQEEEAIREFGSPERIAAIIRADLQGNLDDGGSFTERGYEDERFRDPNYQVAKRLDLPDAADNGNEMGRETSGGANTQGSSHDGVKSSEKSRNMGVGKTILLVLLLLIASPVLLGIGGGLLGITVGLGGGLLGLLAGAFAILFAAIVLLAVLTFALLLAGLAVCVVGAAAMFSSFLDGLLCLGCGLIILAFGLLALLVSVWFYGKFLPWLVRVCVDGISRLFHRRRRAA